MTKPLEPGTIYELTEKGTQFVQCGPGRCRRLEAAGSESDQMVQPKTVLGRLPPDRLDATEWREEYRLPPVCMDYPDTYEPVWIDGEWKARTRQDQLSAGQPQATPLPPGTRFRFRSWPKRWFEKPIWTDTNQVWIVGTTNPNWRAKEGQGFRSDNKPEECCASVEWGVLPTDDIEILSTPELGTEENPIAIEDLPMERIPAPIKLEPGLVVAFRSWPERYPCQPYYDVDLKVPLVVTDDPLSDQDFSFRALTRDGEVNNYCGVDLKETDDLKVLGRIPLDELYTATEIPTTGNPSSATGAAESPSFTWRGWRIKQIGGYHWRANKEAQTTQSTNVGLPALLDRIAEAEGLNQYSVADLEQCREQLATERRAREAAEKELSTLRTRVDSWSSRSDELELQCYNVEQAFRAATGQEYEPGRDYEADSLEKRTAAAEAIMNSHPLLFPKSTPLQETPVQFQPGDTLREDGSLFRPSTGISKEVPKLKEGDRFKFLTFPDDYGPKPSWNNVFVMCASGRARFEKYPHSVGTPIDCWSVEGCTYEILPPKKETPDMSAVRFAKTRFLAKYASLFVLFSALSNPTDIWQFAKDWWTAPTALELGDWTRVASCDSCNAIKNYPGDMCRKCGDETFTERKAQALTTYIWGAGRVQKGHVFQDGTTTLEPGNWLVPERVVNSK